MKYVHRNGETIYRVHWDGLVDLSEKERATVNCCGVVVLNSGLPVHEVEQAVLEYVEKQKSA